MLVLAGNPVLSYYQAALSHVKLISNLEVTSPSTASLGGKDVTWRKAAPPETYPKSSGKRTSSVPQPILGSRFPL